MASIGKERISMGAGLYITAKLPPGLPGYLAAIFSNCLLYASEVASIAFKPSSDVPQAHSLVFSKIPLGGQ